MLVSHDRYVLERVCDRVVGLLGDGRLRDLPGGVEEYLALRASQESDAGSSAAVDDPATSRQVSSAADVRTARKELARVQRRLDRLATEELRLHEALAAAASEHERVLELDTELRAVVLERSALEEEWLGLAEQVERCVP